jgi:hypothetical protein
MANEAENETGADERRLSEADAQRLLERAIQLDAVRSTETSVSELRRVAEELNVSPAAFAEALRELENRSLTTTPTTQQRAAPVEPATTDAPGKRSWWRTLAIGAAGLLTGVSPLAPIRKWDFGNGIGFDRPIVDPGVLLLLAASVYLITYHRRRGTARDFQRDLGALWAGVGLGGLLGRVWTTPLWTPALSILAFGWMACSALGGFLVRRKPPEPTP